MLFRVLKRKWGLSCCLRFCHPQGYARPGHQHIQRDVTGQEQELVHEHTRRRRPVEIGTGKILETQMDGQHHGGDEHHVDCNEESGPVTAQEAVDKPEKIDIEHHHEGQGNYEIAQILRSVHQGPVRRRHEQGHEYHHSPYQGVNQPSGISCPFQYHGKSITGANVSKLLVSYRLYRVQSGRLPGWIPAEEYSGYGADGEGEYDTPGLDEDGIGGQQVD